MLLMACICGHQGYRHCEIRTVDELDASLGAFGLISDM